MAKQCYIEKIILTFLIVNSEIYKLNEQDALKYIHCSILQPISRRTLYNYKKMIYNSCLHYCGEFEDIFKKDLQLPKSIKTTNYRNCKQLSAVNLLILKEDLIQKGLKSKIDLNDFDDLSLVPVHFDNTINRVNSTITNSKTLLERINSGLCFKNENKFLLPDNATVRQEYVKCKKNPCSGCKHGPYYYAYWRENGKLKKKYIGIKR
jgi:hypothetical protein